MISILLPLFNGQEFIDDCIPSILSQTYGKFELLIAINGHDDKSADQIIQKIKSFGDKRVKMMICQKKGKIAALNRLVPHARYNYVALIDIDDKWEPTKLEEQIPFITKYDVVGSDIEYFGEKTGSPELFLGRLLPTVFAWQNPMVSSAVLMKKSDAVWKKEWEGIEDFQLWVSLLKKGKTFYNVPKVLAYHRIHSDSYFNPKNKDAGDQVSLQRVPRLTDEQMQELTEMMEKKAWLE